MNPCLECHHGQGQAWAAPQSALGKGQPQDVPILLCALRNLKIKPLWNQEQHHFPSGCSQRPLLTIF